MPETNFFWEPLSDNIFQERDDTGAVTAEYSTEPGLYGNLISQNGQGAERQYHFDVLGSTLTLTDDDQHITDTSAYTAFGEVAEQTGCTTNPFEYIGKQGYYRNSLTFGYWARARMLFANFGRWASSDPVLSNLPSNRYAYVFNRPLNDTDPSGLGCRVWYTCVLAKADCKTSTISIGGYKIPIGPSLCFCEYNCAESDRMRELVGGIGGVLCDDPRIPKTITYSLSQGAKCEQCLTNVPKIFTETKETVRDCSRKQCREAAEATFKLLKKSCDLVPPHLKDVCKAAADLWLSESLLLCEFCNKP